MSDRNISICKETFNCPLTSKANTYLLNSKAVKVTEKTN